MTGSQKNYDKESKPEEKNLANSQLRQSLWKKRFVQCFKIVGLFVICFGLYILWFVHGEPSIDTDYVSQLNQINRPKNYKQEDNAWPHYKKSIELFVEPNAGEEYGTIFSHPQKRFSELTETGQRLVMKWVEKNQAAWQEFVEASLKPYCYIEYTLGENDEDFSEKLDTPTLKIGSKHLRSLRNLSSLGTWRIKIEMESENIGQAVDDCLTLLNAGTQWHQDKSPIETIEGHWLSNSGYEGLLMIISNKKLAASELKAVQERLTNMYWLNYTAINSEFDKILFLDVVQHTFTNGGLGGGHLIPKYLPPLVQSGSIVITLGDLETEPTFQEKVLYVVMSMLHARRNKTISTYNGTYEQIKEIQMMTPYKRHKANDLIDVKRPFIFNYTIYFDSFIKESRYFLIGLLMPSAEIPADVMYWNRAMYEATITILAIKRYMIENGDYPETLEELLDKGYVKKLPMDPYSDNSMVYKKTGMDFKLYSVGRNFADDGGELAFYSPGHIAKWGDGTDKEGDAVFWPVQ
jgi:hypothetical protein